MVFNVTHSACVLNDPFPQTTTLLKHVEITDDVKTHACTGKSDGNSVLRLHEPELLVGVAAHE